ncbi:hypothetical protein ABIE80_005371 [Bradyrhizobium diazoefficiens]
MGLAVDLAAELLRRHSRRLDRARTHGGGENPVHVGEDADPDGVAFDLCACGGACERQRDQQDSGGGRAVSGHGVS